jgi:hypothetical protein
MEKFPMEALNHCTPNRLLGIFTNINEFINILKQDVKWVHGPTVTPSEVKTKTLPHLQMIRKFISPKPYETIIQGHNLWDRN